MKIQAKLCENSFWTALLAVTAVCGVFAYCYLRVPFMMTNDNFYLKSIVSGEMTGTPEARMYYIGIVFGGVVSLLYRLFPGSAWYGIAVTLSLMAAFSYLLFRILNVCRTHVMRACAIVLFDWLLFGFFTQHIVKSEWTTITGIVGCASLLALYLLDESLDCHVYRKALVSLVLLSVWSVSMRDKAYYMLIPFIGMIFLGKLQDAYVSGEKKNRQNLMALGLALAGAMLIFHLGTAIAYGSSAWREFRVYTDASEEVFGFYGFPDYESHQSLYEEAGIQKSSYEAITGHYNILLDPAINAHSMTLLSDVGKKENAAAKGSLGKRAQTFAEQFTERAITSYAERPVNILVYLVYLLVIPAAVFMKRRRAVRDIVYVGVASAFLWIYLIDGGRFPTRVTQIIYIAQVFLAVGIVIRYRLWELLQIKKGERIYPVGAVAGVMILCVACARFGIPTAKAHISEAESWYAFSTAYRELQEYLAANSDKFYYFDMSHLYFEEEVFQKPHMVYDAAAGKPVPVKNNYLYMGSWMPKSPWYDKVFEQLGITDAGEALITHENIYLLYQEVDFDSWDFLNYYYEEHYPGSELRVVDEFIASNGTKYDIIKGYWQDKK